MARFADGQLAYYQTVTAGRVAIRIVRTFPKIMYGMRVEVRVTARKNPVYPCGLRLDLPESTSFLTARQTKG